MAAWKVYWADAARKQLRKLDRKRQDDILKYLRQRIARAEHPQNFGKPLRYEKYGLWGYRVQDTRIICQIKEKALIVLVLQVGTRKTIYSG